jgi:voltage-gated potassium channel
LELKNHIIVCGFGIVGEKVCEVLKENGKEFIVIEIDPKKVERLKEKKINYIIGDATSQKVLKAAGVENAKAIVTAIDDDVKNLFIIILSKELNKDIIIASRVNSEEALEKIRAAGASITVMPEYSAAKELSREIAKRYLKPW